MNKYYAGIGSRNTPYEVLKLMEQVGEFLAKCGFALRSGGANGADSYFEKGCDIVNGTKEIYLPWKWFNDNPSKLTNISNEAYKISEKYHPAWNRCSQYAKKLMARNSCQVLGKDLNTPSSFIICYTKNGKKVGGTAQAIRIAEDYNIPIFNFGSYKIINEMKSEFKKFIKPFIEIDN